MRLQSRRWWWALLPLLLLCLAAGWFLWDGADSERGWRKGASVSAGRDSAAGIGPPDEAPPALSRRAWEFAAIRDGHRIRLGGLVPEDAAPALKRRAEAGRPDAEVIDDMTAVPGASGGFDRMAEFAVDQLQRLARGSATIRDGALAIDGVAADPGAHAALLAALRDLPPGLGLARAEIEPAVVRPYVWSAAKERDGGLVLSGYAPSAAARDAALAAAHAVAADGKVVDRMQIARGLPQAVAFEAATRYALAQLDRVRTGTAEIRDAAFTLRGEAPDPDMAAESTGSLGGEAAGGLRSASVEITVPVASPYRFAALRGPGTVTLGGYYPDRPTHERIMRLARRRFLTERLVDEMEFAEGAPENYLAGVTFGLDQLSRLASGEARIAGTALHLRGEALYPQTGAQIRERVARALPPGWSGTAEIKAPELQPEAPAEPCGRSLASRLNRERIEFETGSAELPQAATGILDAIAAVLKTCRSGGIEVGGHTDADGEADANRDLSQRRAQAVVDYLVGAGIDRARLAAVGYGESRPLVPNDSDENKAKNRRIDLVVKAPAAE